MLKETKFANIKYGENSKGKPVYRKEETVPMKKITGMQRKLKKKSMSK
jgi:hypothetical protein